jgi:hypothetical protein
MGKGAKKIRKITNKGRVIIIGFNKILKVYKFESLKKEK